MCCYKNNRHAYEGGCLRYCMRGGRLRGNEFAHCVFIGDRRKRLEIQVLVEISMLKKIRIEKIHFSWRNLGFCKKQCPKMELPKKQCKKQCIFSPILALFSIFSPILALFSIVFCKNQDFSAKKWFFWSGFFLASKSQLVLRFPGVCGGPRCTHKVQTHFPSVDPPLRPYLKQPPSY